MSHEHLLSTVTGDTEHQRLDVVLSPTPTGEPELELRRLSWGKGVGWYRQSTLRLDPAEAEALLQTLRTNCRAWRKSPERSGGKVLPFPTCSPGTALGNGRTETGSNERAKRTRKRAARS